MATLKKEAKTRALTEVEQTEVKDLENSQTPEEKAAADKAEEATA